MKREQGDDTWMVTPFIFTKNVTVIRTAYSLKLVITQHISEWRYHISHYRISKTCHVSFIDGRKLKEFKSGGISNNVVRSL
jgi:hypothetical protein